MEYTISAFTDRLFRLIVDNKNFPYMRDTSLDEKKHPNRKPTHLNTEVRNNPNRVGFGETEMFEIGSPNLERNYPHYHILQQAPVIRKRNKGTTKTKGSQMFVKELGQRDYEKVSFNGKTFSKEYERNVRGMRKPKSAMWVDQNGEVHNKDANAYVNIHYKYLDKICDDVAPIIASEFGLKLMRKQSTGLVEEYASQEDVSIESLLEAFDKMI